VLLRVFPFILEDMVYRPKVDDKLCFVLMPFRDPFDGYYEHIIKKAVKAAGLAALRADEIYGTGSIIRDVWDHIWRARVVVADVTGRNPNVNYELGLCHSLGVSTILITQQIEDVPFDYRHRRCIQYDTKDAMWAEKLLDVLKKTIEAALAAGDDDQELRWPYDTFAIRQLVGANATISVENPQQIILRGMAEAERLVSRALGPRGTDVSVAVSAGRVAPQKRGLDIAQGIHSANSIEENGIEQMRKVGRAISDRVGDGTKTAMLLAHALVEGGLSALAQGHPLHDVLRGMEKGVVSARSFVVRNSQACQDEDVRSVALTASSDPEISNLILEAMKEAGKDGVILVETGSGTACELSVQEGLRFDRGYLSSEFVTNSGTENCELTNCRVLVHEMKISNMMDLVPLLEQVARASLPLLVIADDVEGEALATLVVNKVRGSLTCVAVRAPGAGDRRKELLQDIAVLTGAKLFARDLGLRLEAIQLGDLGGADKVVVTKDTTTIFGGHGSERGVREQISLLRSAIDGARDSYARERLQERLANLAGKISTIRIGGTTEVDIEDRTYRAVSAMHSTRVAIEGGWSYGGGVALLNAEEAIGGLSGQSEAEKAGATVVSNALSRPFFALAESCRMSPVTLLAERHRAAEPGIGLNVLTGNLEDIRVAGILDPTKTIVAAIDVAFSYARAILKTAAWSVNPAAPDTESLPFDDK
jgi:chaperonin GroEL